MCQMCQLFKLWFHGYNNTDGREFFFLRTQYSTVNHIAPKLAVFLIYYYPESA